MEGLEEATCPSCSLVVKVIYNKVGAVAKIYLCQVAGHRRHITLVTTKWLFFSYLMPNTCSSSQEMFQKESDLEKKLNNLSLKETEALTS